jgi:nucleotidyltransferase substrate binding protein (TIGR01987 family)
MVKYDAERFDLQREHFEKALARLHEALAEPESPFVRDSIIQRFEFTFEMAWKTLYRFLRDKGEDVAAKAWDVLPVAFQSRLIADEPGWHQLREYRNDTSHEYDEARAQLIAAFVRAQGVSLFEALRDEMRKRVP